MTRYFCTLFDRNYFLKGLAMLESLKTHCAHAHVYVLCMDAFTCDLLQKLALPYVTCISLDAVEDDALKEAKKDRGVAEYCWTLSPCLPWYIFENYAEISQLTYLDADIFFYSSLDPIFQEMADCSIAITEHRFTPRLQDRIVNGRFCVQWVTFQRDTEGLACLKKWREQCIEWCYYRLEEHRMGDQKYLDTWPTDYKKCHIIQNTGAGVAPWNYAQYQFLETQEGLVFVDNTPLIFYHFHQFQILKNECFSRLSSFYTQEKKEPDAIYRAYEKALTKTLAHIRNHTPSFQEGLQNSQRLTLRRVAQRVLPHSFKNWLRQFIRM